MSVMEAVDHAIPMNVAEKLVDPRAYASDEIHEAYRWLRRNEPFGQATI